MAELDKIPQKTSVELETVKLEQEIIEKIKRKHFAEDAIPSVLRVLSSRKKA